MLEIKLFGPITVTTGERRLEAPDLGGVKPRQILEILALHVGNPVPKERLADLLWDGAPPPSYLGTLESYICVLRRSLGLPGGRLTAVTTTTNGYRLDPAEVRVDLTEFRARVQLAGQVDPGRALRLLDDALTLTQGDLLVNEPYATWAIRERGVVQREIAGAACWAAAVALRLREVAVAVRTARLATQTDALAEEGWRLLMQALCASGRRSEALRAYIELKDVLLAELGADPAFESQDLYLSILRDDQDSHVGRRTDGPDEVRMLMRLLRQAVESIPGLEPPRSDRALVEVAARLVSCA